MSVICHWFGSVSWRLYASVMSKMFCSQQPCSSPVDSCRRLLMQLIHLLWGLPLFWLPSTFSSSIFFSRELWLTMMCLKYEGFKFFCLVFSFSDVSGLFCSRTHMFILLVVQGTCRIVLQHHISNKSSISKISTWSFFSLSLLISFV